VVLAIELVTMLRTLKRAMMFLQKEVTDQPELALFDRVLQE